MSNPNQSIKELLEEESTISTESASTFYTNKEIVKEILPVLRKIYESDEYGRIDEYIDEFLDYLEELVK